MIIAFAFSGDGNVGRLVSVVLEGLTLLVILRSSRVHQRVLLAASALVGLAIVACVVAILLDDTAGRRGPVILGAVLALVGPPVDRPPAVDPPHIDLTTVAGALCVYLLAGLFFSYLFWIIGEFDAPFFVQTSTPNSVDFVYFSFVTIATLGYGDLTPHGDLGRMLAATEAIIGQLYLVSAVALLIGNLGRTRTEASPPDVNRPPSRARVARKADKS